ncbi:hypothetical protein [Salinicoccus roseus]|jgi:predicted transcriptional regulator|uniref:hypothetical protein n=1 Tax=Salinicoccus roseus TaxID=45670 RepID=UPI000F503D49|nr:hypothetical protein [Salinicoccus roseus]RPE51819.1 hypothetical protein EDC33_2031 [Salinicoccus roseus]GGA75876.1 hypothetical protein GCM10007176_20200 [Salinicoccus roseus]
MDINSNILGIRFLQKKEAVPYHNRLTYKTTILLLILLKCCRGKGCSISKFQIIMNHLHSTESQKELMEFIKTEQTFIYLRYDSTVIKALEYMKYDGLIETQQNGSFRLTDKGKKIGENIWKDKEIFLFEKKFFKDLGGSLTEKLVKNITSNLFSV